MYWIRKEMLPVYAVQKEGFANLLKQFDPQYKLPSRKYFSKTVIPKLYDCTRESVFHSIKNLKLYSATTDMWYNPYMSYIIHEVTKHCFWYTPGYFLDTKYQVKIFYTALY